MKKKSLYFVVYATRNCPWSKKSIEMLFKEGHTYRFIDILESKEDLQAILDEGHTTVPQVYLWDQPEGEPLSMKHIGGYDELKEFLK